MSDAPASRIPARSCAPLFTSAALFLLTSCARAVEHSCSPADTSFPCRMIGLLHWLEATAWVLAVLFVIVLGIAIHLYRKNRPPRTERR